MQLLVFLIHLLFRHHLGPIRGQEWEAPRRIDYRRARGEVQREREASESARVLDRRVAAGTEKLRGWE